MSTFTGEDISKLLTMLQIAPKESTIFAPYHCPKCSYIWDTKEMFNAHANVCLYDPENLLAFAKEKHIDYFPNVYTHADRQDKHRIPSGRCRAINKKGSRKGKFCLIKIPEDTRRCERHKISS